MDGQNKKHVFLLSRRMLPRATREGRCSGAAPHGLPLLQKWECPRGAHVILATVEHRGDGIEMRRIWRSLCRISRELGFCEATKKGGCGMRVAVQACAVGQGLGWPQTLNLHGKRKQSEQQGALLGRTATCHALWEIFAEACSLLYLLVGALVGWVGWPSRDRLKSIPVSQEGVFQARLEIPPRRIIVLLLI